nr:hypothetical protein [uncultured Dyadobacter sp.]
MKKYSYISILILWSLLSCEKPRPIKPRMVHQVISGEVNGVPFKSGITVEMGAVTRTDLCDDHMVTMGLVRKVEDERYEIMYLDYTPGVPGIYTLTDSLIQYFVGVGCPHDTIHASFALMSYPGDDEAMASYRLLKGPWNYLEILSYDPEKNEMYGKFAAKFARINVLNPSRPSDTITYTNGKFILANIYVQEVITEPR